MSKFIKRLGTTASKFMVELYLTRVELNLVQQCRIAIILKRGDHVVETKNALSLEKGAAKFDEKLVIPATLYKDKKKGTYIKKEATISINVITPKATRLAGVTKLDLSYYPNNNITEQDITHPVEKCFDKNAKLYFKLRMIKVNDIDPERKTQRKKEKEENDKSNNKSKRDGSEDKDLSDSPLPSQINADGSDVHDFTSNSSIPDFSKFEAARSHLGNIGGRGKSPDFAIDDSSDGEQVTGLRGRRSRTFDALKNGNLSEDKSYKGGKFMDNGLSEITTVNDSGHGLQGNQKILELEVKVKNYQKENKELYDKIREDNEEYMSLNQEFEDLKLKYDRLNRDYENLCNDKNVQKTNYSGQEKKTDFELKVYKDKVAKLEEEIEDLKKEKDEANERADELQQATQDLMVKLESYKLKDKSNKKDNPDKLEDYISKNNELNQKLKEAEKKVKELTESKNNNNRSGFSDFESPKKSSENRELKEKIAEYENKIDELERQIGIQQNEIQLMKKMANSSIAKNKEDSNQQMMAQIEQMEKKQKGLEDTYKKRIEELIKQNTDMKRELEQAKSNMSSSQFDTENELAKLSLENESLKRQMKDMSGKLLNVKYDNKEVEEMRRKLVQIEADKDRLDAELVKAKMGWASADIEKDELKSKLKAKENNTNEQKGKTEVLEKEIFRLRSRIAELMNAVMEYGDEELLDEIETIITDGDHGSQAENTGGGERLSSRGKQIK